MPGRIQDEIQITRPLDSAETEAFLNLQRTAGILLGDIQELLKPHGLSSPQYNVLRILRGAGPGGLPSGEIGERMVTRDPDVTRLIDRMMKSGWVVRHRGTSDRRVVRVSITEKGLEILSQLDDPVREAHERQFRSLNKEQISVLISLLETLR
jgi:MarR family transcriptional regulator, organic hydroperoxide resistance regulator